MNDVTELKRFASVHAWTQSITGYRDVLARISTDEPGTEGSWVHEWRRAARQLELDGQYLRACQYYGMARFPYVDGEARAAAQAGSVAAFDRWRILEQPGIERLEVELPDGRVRCWADGLSPRSPRPVLLIMGGIVSPKEQWAQGLLPLRRLGMASIALEMPGVGENTLPYGPGSSVMLSGVLDAVAGRALVEHTYALAASFSGHLALRCALRDRRIRGVASIGAPVSRFFTDREWHRRLPKITADTLAHLTGTPFDLLSGQLAGWRLTEPELASLDIPVCYLASRYDEVVPGSEAAVLRRHLRHLYLVENDDVHASPGYLTETRLWTALSILRMRRSRNLQRLAVSAVWHALRARHRLPGLAGPARHAGQPAPAFVDARHAADGRQAGRNSGIPGDRPATAPGGRTHHDEEDLDHGARQCSRAEADHTEERAAGQ